MEPILKLISSSSALKNASAKFFDENTNLMVKPQINKITKKHMIQIDASEIYPGFKTQTKRRNGLCLFPKKNVIKSQAVVKQIKRIKNHCYCGEPLRRFKKRNIHNKWIVVCAKTNLTMKNCY